MKKTAILVVAVSMLLSAALFAAVQETKPPFKHELVKLNYVHPGEISMLLRPYVSRDGRLEFSESQKFISITDTPENVDKILAAIKEIDVKPPDVLFTIQLVLASEDGAAKTDEALANDPVIKELKGFLKYKSFSLLDTSLVRGTNRQQSAVTIGPAGNYELQMTPDAITADKAQTVTVYVKLRQPLGFVEGKAASQTLIDSSLTMKSGDKTVVGVSRTAGGDKGLILIIQAKVVS